MNRNAQLTLDLARNPARGREDLAVSESNRVAVDWIERWPDWPAGGLALHGPQACGKSHLCAVWRDASGALSIAPAALDACEADDLLGGAKAVCCEFDDLSWAARPGVQRNLLHLFNMLRERGGWLLLTAGAAPNRWPVDLADLRSRLATIPAIAIELPDEQLMTQVLIKLFHDRQLKVKPRVIQYLATRMDRSLGAVHRLVESVDREALATRREVRLPLVREILVRLQHEDGEREPQRD